MEPVFLSVHFSCLEEKINILHRRLYDFWYIAETCLLSKDCLFCGISYQPVTKGRKLPVSNLCISDRESGNGLFGILTDMQLRNS